MPRCRKSHCPTLSIPHAKRKRKRKRKRKKKEPRCPKSHCPTLPIPHAVRVWMWNSCWSLFWKKGFLFKKKSTVRVWMWNSCWSLLKKQSMKSFNSLKKKSVRNCLNSKNNVRNGLIHLSPIVFSQLCLQFHAPWDIYIYIYIYISNCAYNSTRRESEWRTPVSI